MKRNTTAFTFAMALIAGSAYAGGPPKGTTYILFTDHCDGMTINYSGSGSFITGLHDNYNCAGASTFVGGIQATMTGVSTGSGSDVRAALADYIGSLEYNNAAVQYYLDFTTLKYGAYIESSGYGAETLITKGTFTIGSGPASQIGGINSLQGAAPDTDPDTSASTYPAGPYILSWPTSYCEFFIVETGQHQTAGGQDNQYDCEYPNSPFAASNATLASDVTGTAGAALIGTDNFAEIAGYGPDTLLNWYFNFTNGSWAVYSFYTDSSGYPDVVWYLVNGTQYCNCYFTLTPGSTPPYLSGTIPAWY
jgi:hypothetical protein